MIETFNFDPYSMEYTPMRDYILHKKDWNIHKNPEAMKKHLDRNKNQYGLAPKDFKTMMEMCKCGWYIYEGFAPCHNILHANDTKKARFNSCLYTVRLFPTGELQRPNKYAPLNNVSFRGAEKTDFEGCQFIYQYDSGKLVVDVHNRGSWDFGKYATAGHWVFDIQPWIDVGNGRDDETADMFIMSDSKLKGYLKHRHVIDKKLIEKTEKQEQRIMKSFINKFNN